MRPPSTTRIVPVKCDASSDPSHTTDAPANIKCPTIRIRRRVKLFNRSNCHFTRYVTFLILCLILVIPHAVSIPQVHADNSNVVTWNGGTGVWENPTKWSSGSIPTEADDIQINSGVVTISSAQTVGGIIIANGATINCKSCVLDSLTGGIINSGTIVSNRGNIIVKTGDVNNTFSGVINNGPGGVLTVSAGDMNNAGIITNGSGSTIFINVGNIINYGSIDNCSGGTITVKGYTGGTLIVQTGPCLLNIAEFYFS